MKLYLCSLVNFPCERRNTSESGSTVAQMNMPSDGTNILTSSVAWMVSPAVDISVGSASGRLVSNSWPVKILLPAKCNDAPLSTIYDRFSSRNV